MFNGGVLPTASRMTVKVRCGLLAAYEHERMHAVLTERNGWHLKNELKKAGIPFTFFNLCEDIRIESTAISVMGARCFDWLRWGVNARRDLSKPSHDPESPLYAYSLLYAYKVIGSSLYTRSRKAGRVTFRMSGIRNYGEKLGWVMPAGNRALRNTVLSYLHDMMKANTTLALIPIMKGFIARFPLADPDALDTSGTLPADIDAIGTDEDTGSIDREADTDRRAAVAKRGGFIHPEAVAAGEFDNEGLPDEAEPLPTGRPTLVDYRRDVAKDHKVWEGRAAYNAADSFIYDPVRFESLSPHSMAVAERHAEVLLSAMPRPQRVRPSTEPDRFCDVDFQSLMEHRADFWRRRSSVESGTIGIPSILLCIDLSGSMNTPWCYRGMAEIAAAFILLAERGAIRLRVMGTSQRAISYFPSPTIGDIRAMFPNSSAEGIAAGLAVAAERGWHLDEAGAPSTVLYLTDGDIRDTSVNKEQMRAAGIYPIAAYCGNAAYAHKLSRYFDVFVVHATPDDVVSDLAGLLATAATA